MTVKRCPRVATKPQTDIEHAIWALIRHARLWASPFGRPMLNIPQVISELAMTSISILPDHLLVMLRAADTGQAEAWMLNNPVEES